MHFREQFNQNKYHEIYAEAIQVFPDAAPESEASAFFDMVHQKLRDEPGDCGAKVFRQCFHSRNITLTDDSELVHGSGREQFRWRMEDDKASRVRYDISARDQTMK